VSCFAVGVENVGDRQALELGALDQALGSVAGVDQHRLAGFTIAQQIAEVAVAAGPDLLENEHRFLLRNCAPRASYPFSQGERECPLLVQWPSALFVQSRDGGAKVHFETRRCCGQIGVQ
jgi:hypothetical protein